MFSSMIKSRLKYTLIYATHEKSRQHFRTKKKYWEKGINKMNNKTTVSVVFLLWEYRPVLVTCNDLFQTKKYVSCSPVTIIVGYMVKVNFHLFFKYIYMI